MFEFLGRILGKALYEGITIKPQFAHFFLSFLRGEYNFLNIVEDLTTLDSTLYNNLMFLVRSSLLNCRISCGLYFNHLCIMIISCDCPPYRIGSSIWYHPLVMYAELIHFFVHTLYTNNHLTSSLPTQKTYDGDARDLCLTFTVSTDHFGVNKEIPLIPNGADMEVTNANKHHYIGK